MIKDAHFYNFKTCKLYVFTFFFFAKEKTDRETYNHENLSNMTCEIILNHSKIENKFFFCQLK